MSPESAGPWTALEPGDDVVVQASPSILRVLETLHEAAVSHPGKGCVPLWGLEFETLLQTGSGLWLPRQNVGKPVPGIVPTKCRMKVEFARLQRRVPQAL